MAEQYRTVERYGLSFSYPIVKPAGHKLDPTDVVIGVEGETIVPIWRPLDKDFKEFRLCYMEVPTLAAAIRQGDHILSRCSKEIKGVADIVGRIRVAMSLYLSSERVVFLNESHEHIRQLLAIGQWLEGARRPEKQRAFGQLIRVMKGKGRDRLGRYNPCAMASRLFSAIYQLEEKRVPSLERIVVEVAGRKAVLELTRTENQQIIATLIRELSGLLDHALFKTRERPALIWYNRLASQVEQIAVPTKRLWGAPYLQVSVAIHNELYNAIDLLKKQCQLKAAGIIRTVIKEIGNCPRSLQALRRIAVALRKSVDWRTQKFATCMRQLERLGEGIEELSDWLDPITRTLRHTIADLEEMLKRANWQPATQELDRFIARCEW